MSVFIFIFDFDVSPETDYSLKTGPNNHNKRLHQLVGHSRDMHHGKCSSL